MKQATFKDGTIITRKTHTRDYKFAFKVTTIKGGTETGFSTTLKNAKAVATSIANWSLETNKKYAKLRGDSNWINSEKAQQLKEKCNELIKSI